MSVVVIIKLIDNNMKISNIIKRTKNEERRKNDRTHLPCYATIHTLPRRHIGLFRLVFGSRTNHACIESEPTQVQRKDDDQSTVLLLVAM